ncbi:BON domain-containing protein [Aeoliella mucimassa]|uniref:BON domain-containing protein n=1 Tax=Aeoliella mucimassa TaxID=2527972 RepID=A0A518AL31_9BACT|nr:BON domain-containing protein [Aeoliella mucimassa]QDU55438.1 hypothetical protein Pan181_16270 [Aeoliella mucimassa]
MSRHFRQLMIVATVAGFFAVSPVWGQGIGGSRTTGTGTTGMSSGIGTSGIGGSSLGGGIGTSGIGSGGFGTSGIGQGGFGQSTSGIGNQSNSGFVGRTSDDVTNMFNNMTRQNTQGGQSGRTRNSSNRSTRSSSSNRVQQPVRVTLKVAFDHPAIRTPQRTIAENEKVMELLTDQNLSGVSMSRSEGRVVLGGTAPTAWDRKVAEKLVSLQPTVVSVSNEMSVSETVSTPSPE